MVTRVPRTYIAILAAALALSACGEVQLLPAGEFSARDGRPGPGKKWVVTDADGQRLAEKLCAQSVQTEFLFDIDHQTIRAEANGQPAPAAGWATRFEWRAGKGLFATDVRWTESALKAIEAGEYRYISPVIAFDSASGRVVGVQMAAITNFPALLGMEPIGQALSARLGAQYLPDETESSMKLLAALAALFALPASATEDDAIKAVTTFKAEADAAKAKPAALSGQVVTALGLQAGADEKAALSAITALQAKAQGADATTATTIAALQGQLATLTAQAAEREVDQVVQAALSAGKLVPAQVDWARKQGKADLSMLKAYIDSAPVIAKLQAQTGGRDPSGGGDSEHSAEALAGKALAYQAEQAKAGITVTTAQAVLHVNKGPAPAAT